jgi:hypothetical protein
MAKKTAKHRVKMIVEIVFGFHDDVEFSLNGRLATQREVLQELKQDLKRDGLAQFVRQCDYTPKTKLKSIGFVKFDK